MGLDEDREPDFRSKRMPSPEGLGLARGRWGKAWDAYARTVNKAAAPVTGPAVRRLTGPLTTEVLGFWLMWQLYGGFEGLQRIGMSRSAIYRRIALFRKVFGQHPDEYVLPGVSVDVQAFLAGIGKVPAVEESPASRD